MNIISLNVEINEHLPNNPNNLFKQLVDELAQKIC